MYFSDISFNLEKASLKPFNKFPVNEISKAYGDW